jgi:hypothetical protein
MDDDQEAWMIAIIGGSATCIVIIFLGYISQ